MNKEEKDKLLKEYYADLRSIRKTRMMHDSDELQQLYYDKLFQIKYLLRYDKEIVYDYE